MTSSRPLSATVISANDAFKLRYPRYLKGAVLAALVLTVLFIWLWPGYEGFVASSTNPVLLTPARADYPVMARRAGIQGTVTVQVRVGVDGRTRGAGENPAGGLRRRSPKRSRVSTRIWAWRAGPIGIRRPVKGDQY